MDITEMVKDILPGSYDGLISNRIPFYPFEDFMLFEAQNENGVSLWKTDGTQAGTVEVYDVNPWLNNSPLQQQPQNFIPFHDAIYFVGYDNQQSVSSLWKTDGTTEGTVEIHPLSNYYTEFVRSGDALYFCNTDPNHGRELWKSDGTQAGTQMVKDMNPGPSDSNPYNLFAIQNKVVFEAAYPQGEPSRLTKLWVSDGTESGTFILKDFRPADRFEGYFIGEYNSDLYFIANDGTPAIGLWKTDGTEAGTQKIKAIDTTPYGPSNSPIIVYHNILYFSCMDSIHGTELWRTDGSEAGTYILKEFVLGVDGIDLKTLKIINDLLFLDIDIQGQSQQWISDGTESGTVLLTDLSDVTTMGNFKTEPLYMNVIYNTLIFAGWHNIYNTEPMFYRMDRGDTNLVLCKN